MTNRASIIQDIATRVLGIETLETRHRDSLDVHDCPVWSLRKALDAAYEAGVQAGRKTPEAA